MQEVKTLRDEVEKRIVPGAEIATTINSLKAMLARKEDEEMMLSKWQEILKAGRRQWRWSGITLLILS